MPRSLDPLTYLENEPPSRERHEREVEQMRRRISEASPPGASSGLDLSDSKAVLTEPYRPRADSGELLKELEDSIAACTRDGD
jgi:hypothetical protein